MRVKCVSCGHELNLDHRIFNDYSGPVKCFACSAMMEVKTTGGRVYSINSLAPFENKGPRGGHYEKRTLKSIPI